MAVQKAAVHEHGQARVTAVMGRRTHPDDIEVRYPLQPLLDSLDTPTLHDAARILRLSGTTLERLEQEGLTWWQADRYACRIGSHPSWIWPTWWADTPNDTPV